ncbi:restriction endonuclease subunit S, partial [Rhodococcus yananensis]|uniref:restriction endonuclease subunit S n=1 Tax=Rhodococcus yananensis TaxID=2879464 RepID=UPI001CF8B2D8
MRNHPEDWKSMTLGELLAATGGSIKTGPFGTILKASEYSTEGVPIISVGEVGYGSLRVSESTPRAPRQVVERLPEYRLRSGDIVFGRKGAVDRSAWVTPREDGWFLGSDGIRLRLAPTLDTRFIAYQIQSSSARQWLLQHATGSTMLSLSRRVLENLPVIVPPIAVQHAISDVLAALDDKIAANRKLAATAESLLSARFAELSIDVDHGDQISLDNYFELNPKCSKPISDEPTYLDMQKLPASEILVSEWGRRPGKGGTRFTNGDVLLARITPCLENGKVGYVDFLDDGEVALGSTEYIVLRARSGVPRELAYFLAKSPRFRSTAIQHMVGTSGRQRLSAADVAGFTVRQVDSDVLEEWGRLSSPLVKHLGSLRNENRTLAAVRDTLLPRLMSGELRVRDAEKSVE